MAKEPITKTLGSRKRATARVWLYEGSGEIEVNGQPAEEYFSFSFEKSKVEQPFILTETKGNYDASIKVEGGGKSAQLDAVVHGLARGLDEIDESHHKSLKKAGLLTRDAREKERRKPGRAHSARAKRQSPKR